MSKKAKRDGDDERPSSDDTAFNDYQGSEDDIRRVYQRRQDAGHFCGFHPGRKICIANLGWAFDADQLRQELARHLTGLVSVSFAGTVVESKPLHLGHGCLSFDSVENAVKGLVALDGLYLDVPGLPLPRPIVSYFPMFDGMPWGEADVPGYRSHQVAPHFCQMNTFEWDAACEWRLLQRQLALAKKRLCDVFEKQLCKEFVKYKQDVDVEIRTPVASKEAAAKASRTVVCKGISTQIRNDQIRNAIEMAEHCGHVRRLTCPVTGGSMPTVLIELRSPEQATSFVEDVTSSLFFLGLAPRPVCGEAVKFGPAKGFEGVYDRAVESVFGQMQQLDFSDFGNVHLVETGGWKTERRETLERLRLLMNQMMEKRMAWRLESYSCQWDLHRLQNEWIDRELKKLEKLERFEAGLGHKA